MKKILIVSSIFLLGFLTGELEINLIEMKARGVYREVIRVILQTDQEALASRAAREGHRLRSLVHRWNSVYAASPSPDGFSVFRKEWKDLDRDFWFPFTAHVLELISRPLPVSKGSQLSEGILRGKLGATLESLGAEDLANEQWSRAKELLGKTSLVETRRLIEDMLENEKSDAHLRMEKTLLEGLTPPNQTNAADR